MIFIDIRFLCLLRYIIYLHFVDIIWCFSVSLFTLLDANVFDNSVAALNIFRIVANFCWVLNQMFSCDFINNDALNKLWKFVWLCPSQHPAKSTEVLGSMMWSEGWWFKSRGCFPFRYSLHGVEWPVMSTYKARHRIPINNNYLRHSCQWLSHLYGNNMLLVKHECPWQQQNLPEVPQSPDAPVVSYCCIGLYLYDKQS